MKICFVGSTAEDFYTHIRCGILHSAQTKAESRLAGAISSKQNCLRCKSLQRVGVIEFSRFSVFPGSRPGKVENFREFLPI